MLAYGRGHVPVVRLRRMFHCAAGGTKWPFPANCKRMSSSSVRARAARPWRVSWRGKASGCCCWSGASTTARSYYGTYLGALIYCRPRSLLFTQEGLNIVRPLMVGGATSMYCGCAAPPPAWLKDKLRRGHRRRGRRDDRRAGDRARCPPSCAAQASTRIAQAGQAPGLRLAAAAQVHAARAQPHVRLRRQVHAGLPLRRQVERRRVGGRGGRGRAPTCAHGRSVERVLIEDGQRRAWQGTLAGQPFTATRRDGGAGCRRHRHAAHPAGFRSARRPGRA